jgi:hypothetical protein
VTGGLTGAAGGSSRPLAPVTGLVGGITGGLTSATARQRRSAGTGYRHRCGLTGGNAPASGNTGSTGTSGGKPRQSAGPVTGLVGGLLGGVTGALAARH